MGLIKGLFVFGLGMYAGVYVAQNYQVPSVERPAELWTRLQVWLDDFNRQYKKVRKDD